MDTIHSIDVQGISIPSNINFAPINPGYSKNGSLNNDLFNFHASHAGKRIGIYYVGNVAMQKAWSSNTSTVVLLESEANTWRKLTGDISAAGSIPGIQLAWKPESLTMQRRFVTKNLGEQISAFKEFYSSFDNIDYVASVYIDNITKARSLGFKVIQLHAAHGYALSLLLSRSVSGLNNPVNTKGVELIRTIIDKLDRSGLILDIRVSLYEGIDDTQEELDYKSALFKIFVDLGFDIISISNGFYNINKQMIYPPKTCGPVILEEAIMFAKKHPEVVWNVSGNMEITLCNRYNLPENLSMSIGRQLMADPSTIVKIENNDIDGIKWCTECGACHYYSYSLRGIQPCLSTSF